jgi:nucleoside-diphosphate-sugar epimerase
MPPERHILMTGAAGTIGTMLRRGWADRYQLRLADVRAVDTTAEHESFLQVDITNLDQMRRACEGMDTVVHLAADGNPNGDFYDSLLHRNVIGTYNAFQAAVDGGCRRLVFASSIHAVWGRMPASFVTPDEPVHPANVYGATKCWGEALARSFHRQHGLSGICVRIGSPLFRQDGVWDQNEPTDGITERDLVQLFWRCVDVEDVGVAIVHGVSRHRKCLLDLEDTCRVLGYEPEDGTVFAKESK